MSLNLFLRRAGVDLRASEGRNIALLFAYSFVLGIFQFSSKAVRQATFIDEWGASNLPFVYLAVALCAFPVLQVYNRGAGRFRREVVLAATVVLVAAGTLAFYPLFSRPTPWVAVAYYVWIGISSALLVSQFWSYINTVLDLRQARRLFGFVGSGSLLGGAVGGQVARLCAEDPRQVLLLAAAILLFALPMVFLATGSSARLTLTGEGESVGADRKGPTVGGFATLWRSPHVGLIAFILFLTVAVSQIVDLQFNWAVERTTETLAQRAALFGNLYTVMGIGAFLFQVVVTPRVFRVMGVAGALRVLPGYVGLMTLALVLAGGFFPGLLIIAATTLRVGENGLRYSLDHATRELLFAPVPAAERSAAKTYVDVVIHRFGKAAGALLLLTVTFGWLDPVQVSVFSAVLIFLWWRAAGRARGRYVEQLRSGLVGGSARYRGSETEIDVNSVEALEVLVESLGSPDAGRVLRSVDLLAASGRGHLVPPLLLYHDACRVRLRVLEVLAAAARKDAVPLIERSLGDEDAEVRVAAVQALATLVGRDRFDLMRERLEDPDPRVRGAAIRLFVQATDEATRASAETALVAMLNDASAEERAEAASILGVLPEPRFQGQLVRLLFDHDWRVQKRAIGAVHERALRGETSPLFVPILVSQLHDRRLKHEARRALVAHGKQIVPALRHFLTDPNEHIWVRRALPKTLVEIEDPSSTEALWEVLGGEDDLFLRRKVIEALSRVGGPMLHRQAWREQIRRESRRAARVLAQASALGASVEFVRHQLTWRGPGNPGLLERMLTERFNDHRRNATQLIALKGRQVEEACVGLASEDARARARSIEYLDNVLSDPERSMFLSLMDGAPIGPRARSEGWLDKASPDAADTLRDLILTAARHEGDEWLAGAALHEIGVRHMVELYPLLEHAELSESALLREIATFVRARVIA